MNNDVKSAARTLDLLEIFAALPAPIGVSDLARRLGIPKSSTSLLLRTLLLRGYVTRDGDGLYRQSLARGSMASGPAVARLVGVARPVMASVVKRTGETAFLGIPTADGQVQYIEKVVSPQAIRYDAEIDSPRPARRTSTGRVFLAFATLAAGGAPSSSGSAEPKARRPGDGRELAGVRRDGYAVGLGGHIREAAGVAAPIFGQDGTCIAALNVSAPAWRFDAQRTRIIAAVTSGAGRISRLLGHNGRESGMRGGRPGVPARGDHG